MAVTHLIIPFPSSLARFIIMLSRDSKEPQLYEVNRLMVR